jgi:hypothetical protein
VAAAGSRGVSRLVARNSVRGGSRVWNVPLSVNYSMRSFVLLFSLIVTHSLAREHTVDLQVSWFVVNSIRPCSNTDFGFFVAM